ncbi:MAG: Na+/H+ antiporter NhaC family protein [Muribaculaceae bacterium]|nr:Na+/H+ antiporter NhaC family protein [Muribaculaceae bacterium]
MQTNSTSTFRGLLALSPVAVFLISYVAVSAWIGDFYSMPVSVSLVLASVWAIVIYRDCPLPGRIEVFSRSAGHVNILYMIWIFILAGAFASLARELGAVEATVNLALRIFPREYIAPMMFVAACFISLSIGTSVGTVVALTPLAVDMASAAGMPVPFYVAVILGGAFFGDNLSFISDTTIAATRSQEVGMRDKFRANLAIVLPAAIVTLALYVVMGQGVPHIAEPSATDWWLMTPYLVVIATAVMGINVTVVLTCGIVTAIALGLFRGVGLLEMARHAGAGIDSMGELITVTLLAAGMLGIIKEAGGIRFLLSALTARVSGTRGAQAVIAVLVGLVNLCTANNTVAIITVGSIARDISSRYGIDRRKSASILDTASCIVQCLIPYGAQTLLATGLAGISPAAPWPYLYYPWALGIALGLSIIIRKKRTAEPPARG